jgi:very-short-patch-repair endonuclease/predicted transcriptional regulator of viral defense system
MRQQYRVDRDDPNDAAKAERAIAALAAKQCGVVSARQLHVAGFDGSAIHRRVHAGRLHRVHRGVYLVGHAVAADGAAEMAALLSSGDGSVVSHRSSALLWRLSANESWRTPVEVTVPGRDPGVKPGIRAYRVRALDRRDVRRVRGVPVTSPARTLLDLAGILPLEVVESAFAEARVRKLVSDKAVAEQLERGRGRRGAAALRRLLDLERGPALTRSEAERKLVKLLRAAALPAPEVNAWVGRFPVDFLWRGPRVIVEVDGRAYHSSARAFERDRERDAILVSGGYVVIRITWRQLIASTKAVIARIASTLAVRATGPGS